MESLVKNHVGRHCPPAIQNFLKLRMNALGMHSLIYKLGHIDRVIKRLLQFAETHVGRHFP